MATVRSVATKVPRVVRRFHNSSGGALMWRELDAWPHEAAHWCRVPKPWQQHVDNGAYMLRASGLVPEDVRAAAAALVSSTTFDRDADSVDGLPSHELRWCREGSYTNVALEGIFRETIEERVLPLLRASPLHRGTDLVLCEALVRCYAEGERLAHPAHYDADALVTCVFEVEVGLAGSARAACARDGNDAAACEAAVAAAAAAPARGFKGGFYVQPGAHISSRMPIVMEPGDLVAHSFDLQHGVEVTRGRRCSVVLWFTDSAASCADKTRPWYAAPAAAGDACAQYNLAKDCTLDDPRAALALMTRAAEQGHFMAQNDLGAMLLEGRGLPGALPDEAAAERWLRASAGQGFQRAMVSLAVLESRRGHEAAALGWLERAAEQKDAEVLFRLGAIYANGWLSAEADVPRARRLLREAAEQGHPSAMLALGRLLLRLEEPEAAEAAVHWLRRAAEQGSLEATVALAKRHASTGEVGAAVRVVADATRRLTRRSSKWSWTRY